MTRTPRCLLPGLAQATPGAELPLADADAHHLGRVLRLADGAPIELVDGAGALARATWDRRGRARIGEHAPRQARPPACALAVAPPRPARLDWLVEKAAELGVDSLALLDCAHAARDVGDARVARLRRIAGEALLQSRRLHLMEVVAPRPLAAVLAGWRGALWLGRAPDDPTGQPAAPGGAAPAPRPLLILVGPEGGFTAEEERAARAAGAADIALGSGVLRVETAALVLAVRAGLG